MFIGEQKLWGLDRHRTKFCYVNEKFCLKKKGHNPNILLHGKKKTFSCCIFSVRKVFHCVVLLKMIAIAKLFALSLCFLSKCLNSIYRRKNETAVHQKFKTLKVSWLKITEKVLMFYFLRSFSVNIQSTFSQNWIKMQSKCSQNDAKCSQNSVKIQLKFNQNAAKDSQNAVKMQSKCRQNLVKMQPKNSQNAVKIQSKCSQKQSKCSQNMVKMQPKNSQKSVKMQSNLGQNAANICLILSNKL